MSDWSLVGVNFTTRLRGCLMMRCWRAAWWGHGRVRDVLAHVTTWDEEALKALPVIVEGRTCAALFGRSTGG